MGQFTDDAEQFEDSVEVAEALETLQALLPRGLKALTPGLIRAFERDDYSSALSQARDLYSKGGPSDRESALLYATLLTNRGLTKEAAGVLRRALDVHERDMALQLAQVCNLMVEGNWRAAEDLLGGLREVDVRDPKMWGLMGDVYLELGEDDDTVACYERALEHRSQDADLAYRLARLLFEQGRDFDATSYLERAARIATQDARLWALVAEAWDDLDELDRAVDAWSRVARLDGDDEEAWLNYGAALRRNDDLHEARDAFERVIDLDPFCYEALLELAHIQFDMGYMEEALQAYRKLLKEQPGHVEALHGAAAAAFEQGDVALAEDFARRALERSPDRAESHYNLAVILLELGRSAESSELLERSIELGATPGALLTLALISLRGGALDVATTMIARAHALCEDASEREGITLEFAEALVERGMGEHARALMAGHDSSESTWSVLQPLIEYLSYAGQEEDGATLEALVERFERACETHRASLPLDWDMEGLERVAWRLPRVRRGQAEAMIRQIE